MLPITEKQNPVNKSGFSTLETYVDSIIYSQVINNIPEENRELIPGLAWGNFCQLYTPAFWKFMYLINDLPENQNIHRFGNNIIEEIVACLLGGYGMPSELGTLAFDRLQKKDLIKHGVSFSQLIKELSTPFISKNGIERKYRFYNQKSNFIYQFLNRADLNEIPNKNDLLFRKWLLSINGIGPKTASWITRNWMKSENVAILDIHILRAGMIAGFFKKNDDVSKKYFEMETSYILFCNAMEVLPSNMDTIIWGYMKKTNKLALKALSYSFS